MVNSFVIKLNNTAYRTIIENSEVNYTIVLNEFIFLDYNNANQLVGIEIYDVLKNLTIIILLEVCCDKIIGN